MVFEHTSYRNYLKSVMAERIGRNHSYSLRAFGRDLGMDVGQLSGVLKGQKGLSLQKAVEVSAKLGMDEKAAEYFCLLVQYEQAKTPELKQTLLKRIYSLNGRQRMVDLSIELFQAISDWYHIAIIEMTELHDFDLAPKSAAKRLGISVTEAEVAIERLERLELIEKDESGRYRKAHFMGLFQSPHTHQALRKYHQRMLEKASRALEEQPPEDRYIASDTFSIDVSQLDEARQMITEFREKLVQHFNRGTKRTQTYHFIAELFRLTRKES